MQKELKELENDKGSSLAIVALSLSAILLLVAGVCDIASMLVIKTRMQTSADAVTAVGGALVNDRIFTDATANHRGRLRAGENPAAYLTDRNRDAITEDIIIRRSMGDYAKKNLADAGIASASMDADYPVPFNTVIRCGRKGNEMVSFQTTIAKKQPFLFGRLWNRHGNVTLRALSQQSVRLCP